jgi:hypothetical protein
MRCRVERERERERETQMGMKMVERDAVKYNRQTNL